MRIPSVSEVFAAIFAAGGQAEPEPGRSYDGPCVGRPGPVTTDGCLVVLPGAAGRPEPMAEADLWTGAEADLWTGPGWDPPLGTGPEAEAEWATEWDSADSAAYQARVEAGLEPEVEP